MPNNAFVSDNQVFIFIFYLFICYTNMSTIHSPADYSYPKMYNG